MLFHLCILEVRFYSHGTNKVFKIFFNPITIIILVIIIVIIVMIILRGGDDEPSNSPKPPHGVSMQRCHRDIAESV